MSHLWYSPTQAQGTQWTRTSTGRLPKTQVAPRILITVVVVKGVRAIRFAMAPFNFDDVDIIDPQTFGPARLAYP